MDPHNVFKNHHKEQRLFAKRAKIAVFFCTCCMLILLFRVAYLQIVLHDRYATMSEKNRVNVIPLPPYRGKIYDRNGEILADNKAAFALHVIPYYNKDLTSTLKKLKKYVSLEETEITSFKKRVKYSNPRKSIALKFNLTEEEIARFSINEHKFEGISIENTFIRVYPHKKLAAHILGYVARISETDLQKIDKINYAGTNFIGKTGIEKYYETRLHGNVGFRQVETDAKGNVIRILREQKPISGRDLHLTIDLKLQAYVEKLLADRRAVAIVMDPRNGDILAMASSPSFDPNIFVKGVDQKTYAALNDGKSKALFNRAIQGQYSPASIIKPIVALAGLDTQIIDSNTATYDPGWYKLRNDKHLYRCWKKVGHGWMDLNRAIVESCDTYFYKLSDLLGIDALSTWYEKFGLGRKTGIDLNNEATGLVPSKEWKLRAKKEPWYRGETIIAGIGQGFVLTTPLQMLLVNNAFATPAKQAVPHLLLRDFDYAKKEYVDFITEHNEINIAQDKHWHTVRESMKNSVHTVKGTSYNRIGRKIKYTMAGKTGTSQVISIKQNEHYNHYKIPEHLRDHSIFIGFAPYKEPQFSVIVMLENNPGSSVIAEKIVSFLMKNIKKQIN